jgi:hypothetical protein
MKPGGAMTDEQQKRYNELCAFVRIVGISPAKIVPGETFEQAAVREYFANLDLYRRMEVKDYVWGGVRPKEPIQALVGASYFSFPS